jgi:hypothetical protein
LPHCEQRIRCASCSRVADQPTRRAKASGVISRAAPHLQVTRTRNWPKQSSSFQGNIEGNVMRLQSEVRENL